MPVALFTNNDAAPARFSCGNSDQSYDIPHLGTLGVRYVLPDGEPDRTISVLSRGTITYWCDAPSLEIEVVEATPVEKLLWDVCVNEGFCGGVINDVPTHVTDLLPTSGTVSAELFAELAIQAECENRSPDVVHQKWRDRLIRKFVAFLGAGEVPAESFFDRNRLPFDSTG